jgi:hypothetical protein
MAVLVEAISVIVRRDSIDREYRGGWEAFLDAVPNATLCYDEELARVGFMTPDDAEQFLEVLMAHGLTFLEHDRSKDIAIVVQERGPVTPCEWLGFGQLPLGTGRVSACWLSEGPRGAASDRREEVSIRLATPPDWNLEGSLSQRFTSVPATEIGDRLRFLRTEGDVEVYLDVTTGREVYIGRTS